jgi:2-polyprenyl-3-methyl-5-hydroxy-6-metoxy-1,4-benzoquinol methylase
MAIHFPEENTQEKRDKPFPYSLDLFEEDGYGNRFIKSMPTPLELQEFYAKNFSRQSYQRLGKMLEAFHRAWFCRRLLSKFRSKAPAILEIGSGNGQFLAACRSFLPSANLSAVEFSNPALLAVAASKRITCFDSLEALESQCESYDLIALWHVVEHMIDPWSHIARLLPLLKPEGIIVFSTPNMFCLGVRRFPASWPWNQSPPVHLWHFGPQNLQKRLEYLFPNLLIKVFTRESRDANFLFDAFIRPRIFDRLLKSAEKKLRLQALFRLFVACINEALVNPVLRRKGYGGAEIIAVLEKNHKF